MLVGHLDTVVAHEGHRPLSRDGDELTGSGTVDMKGGVALALGVMRELAARPELYAEVAVLLVNDEEWRTVPFAHTERFAGWDACLCFEAGEVDSEGRDAVIVRRKAAGTLEVQAHGTPAHSGSAPHRGRSALLALATVAQGIAAASDPAGPERLTAVPTILRSGEAFNVVPPRAGWSATCARTTWPPSGRCSRRCPSELDGVSIESALVRAWPGMDTRAETTGVLERRGGAAGAPAGGLRARRRQRRQPHRPGRPAHLDGLGPRGGGPTRRTSGSAPPLRPGRGGPGAWLRRSSTG